jgi:hypothetical protein
LLDDNDRANWKKRKQQRELVFKAGGSYFTQTASTEFPVVGGQLPNRDVYVGTLSNNKLASRESVTGSFGKVLELE